MISLDVVGGAQMAPFLDDLARLRIDVFRAWPYLYEGDMDYERRYLAEFSESPGAVLAVARDGARLVGAATGAPLEDHAGAFGAPFEAAGYDLHEIFYCAESVLLPDYRGQGIGHRFFDARETHGRRLGRKKCCFCAVTRSEPAPEGYRALDDFWRGRGYEPVAGLTTAFSWRDVGAQNESEKQMQFWMKSL